MKVCRIKQLFTVICVRFFKSTKTRKKNYSFTDFKDIADELLAVFDTIQGKCDFENADVIVHGDLALTAMKCEYTHMNGTLTSLPPVA